MSPKPGHTWSRSSPHLASQHPWPFWLCSVLCPHHLHPWSITVTQTTSCLEDPTTTILLGQEFYESEIQKERGRIGSEARDRGGGQGLQGLLPRWLSHQLGPGRDWPRTGSAETADFSTNAWQMESERERAVAKGQKTMALNGLSPEVTKHHCYYILFSAAVTDIYPSSKDIDPHPLTKGVSDDLASMLSGSCTPFFHSSKALLIPLQAYGTLCPCLPHHLINPAHLTDNGSCFCLSGETLLGTLNLTQHPPHTCFSCHALLCSAQHHCRSNSELVIYVWNSPCR